MVAGHAPTRQRYADGMPLLYHWTRENYRADLQGGVAWHLNQRNVRLRDIDRGDSVWAFTRNAVGAYVLAAELVVRAKTSNAPGFRYGPYRVWADVPRSRFFQVDGQAATEGVLRELSIRPAARVLGQGFQGLAAVQTITAGDHMMLAEASRSLALEPARSTRPRRRWRPRLDRRAQPTSTCLCPRTSAAWAGGNAPCAASRDRLGSLVSCGGSTRAAARSASGRRAPPTAPTSARRAVHGCDALLDFEDSTPVFDFGDGHRERVRLDRHLGLPLTG